MYDELSLTSGDKQKRIERLFQTGRGYKMDVTLIWPTIFGVTIFFFKTELKAILLRLASSKDLQLSIGPLAIQARAMREIDDAIGINFPEETVSKLELKALIDTKVKSLQANMERQMADSSIRNDNRVVSTKKILIIADDGEEYQGETLDISQAGIGFKSNGRLRFHERVKIKPIDSKIKIPMLNEVMIVRIEQSDEGYYYGAKEPR